MSFAGQLGFLKLWYSENSTSELQETKHVTIQSKYNIFTCYDFEFRLSFDDPFRLKNLPVPGFFDFV